MKNVKSYNFILKYVIFNSFILIISPLFLLVISFVIRIDTVSDFVAIFPTLFFTYQSIKSYKNKQNVYFYINIFFIFLALFLPYFVIGLSIHQSNLIDFLKEYYLK